jgi:hypothetical protein
MKLALCAMLLAPATALADDAPQRVVVPLPDYLRIYEAARDKPAPPSREATVASADLTGVVEERDLGAAAVMTARMQVQVHAETGHVRLPLLSTKAALLSATIDGRDAPIAVEGPWYTLVTERKGAFDVVLKFAVSVGDDGGLRRVSFQLPPVGATTVELKVPSPTPLAFEIPGGVPLSARHEGSVSTLTTSVPASGALLTTWRRAAAQEVARDPRVYAEVDTLVTVGDGLLRSRATIHETVLFAGVDAFEVQIPAGMTVLDVKGAGLSDWTLDDAQVLTARLGYEAEGSWSFAIEMERALAPGEEQLTAPVPVPLGAERVTGFLGVESRGNQEVTATQVTGAGQVDVRTLPASILGVTEQPVLLGFKHLGGAPSVGLDVRSYDEIDVLVTLVDQAVANTRWTRDGRRLTSVAYEVRNNRRQYLRLSMPDGAELWSAAVAGKAVQPALGPDGAVLLPLVRSQTAGGSLASFTVQVVYVEDGAPPSAAGAGVFQAELPRADVPVTWLGWTVWAPYDAKVPGLRRRGGTLHAVAYTSPPMPSGAMYAVDDANLDSQVQAQMNSGALGSGAAPVAVSFPLDGRQLAFEKLLVLDEPLTVQFSYRGLR